MKKKSFISICIISMIIISSVFVVQSIQLQNEGECNTNDIPTNSYLESYNPPDVEISKKIWDGIDWVDSITANIDDIIIFNITITFYEYCGYKATDIVVNDVLPYCLDYTPGDAIVKHDGNTYNGESMTTTTIIGWELTKKWGIELFEDPISQQSVYIEFPTKVIDYTDENGDNNSAHVTILESCCGVTRYGLDNAIVIVEEPPELPDVDIIKKVYYGSSWVDSATVDIGDDVEFITVTNTGNIDLTDVLIVDDLPDFLVYNDDAVPVDTTSSDHHIEWELGTLTIGDSQIILFSANAIAVGDSDNYYY